MRIESEFGKPFAAQCGEMQGLTTLCQFHRAEVCAVRVLSFEVVLCQVVCCANVVDVTVTGVILFFLKFCHKLAVTLWFSRVR